MGDEILWILFGILMVSIALLIFDLIKLIQLHKKFPKLIQAYKEGILETNNMDLINEFLGD